MLSSSHNPDKHRIRAQALGVGIGLRAAHYEDLLTEGTSIEWLEAHTENYLGDGGYDLHVLTVLRERHPISLHGVGLGLGSTTGYSYEHLTKVAALIHRIDPVLVSEHLCWGASGRSMFNELLPLPLTREALRLMAERVDHLQNVLGRRVLIENITSYVRFRHDEFDEAEFLNALAAQTGCGILLDINNLYVNQRNHGTSATAIIDAVVPQYVGEIHLAGHRVIDDFVIDDHGAAVDDAVWCLYAHALHRLGEKPTLIERDNNLPALSVLTAEANRARRYYHRIHAHVAVA